MSSGWGIQVGAFSTPLLARQATDRAVQLSPLLKGSHVALDEGTKVHRARLDNLSENQARKACETLISNNSPCFVYKAGTQNL
ncbi:MAG: SPOR domain-containing protein [Alphaproteobacteria bacterium]